MRMRRAQKKIADPPPGFMCGDCQFVRQSLVFYCDYYDEPLLKATNGKPMKLDTCEWLKLDTGSN